MWKTDEGFFSIFKPFCQPLPEEVEKYELAVVLLSSSSDPKINGPSGGGSGWGTWRYVGKRRNPLCIGL